MSLVARLFRRKKQSEVESSVDQGLVKHFTTFDLLCVGIGSTIGSGVFVLTGLIARDIAGPFTPLCWLVAGVASLLSAYSYAELSYKYPQSGSSYVYVFNIMGELPAFISAACLTLEYGISAAAVARSWGEKLDTWTQATFNYRSNTDDGVLNVPGALLQLICVFILYWGIDLSKRTINFFTILKMVLVLFMITAGFVLFQPDLLENVGGLYDGQGTIGPDNVSATVTTGGTFTAVFAGATSCFFGYVGYDEVCCLSGECIDKRSMPWAVFGTIVTSMLLYILASLALVGMQPYQDINEDEGFAAAFDSHSHERPGWEVVSQIVAVGELVVLPVVVLISFLAQPRLLYAMARDDLVPKLFARVNDQGNLTESILLTGLVFTILALVTPFAQLESMVSAGILVNFNVTNIAYVMSRFEELSATQRAQRSRGSSYTPPLESSGNEQVMRVVTERDVRTGDDTRGSNGDNDGSESGSTDKLFRFNLCAILFSIMLSNAMYSSNAEVFGILAVIVAVVLIRIGWLIASQYNSALSAVAAADVDHTGGEVAPFKLSPPFFPAIPLTGVVFNWFLFAQLPWSGFLFLGGYFALTICAYISTLVDLRWLFFVNPVMRSSFNALEQIDGEDSLEHQGLSVKHGSETRNPLDGENATIRLGTNGGEAG